MLNARQVGDQRRTAIQAAALGSLLLCLVVGPEATLIGRVAIGQQVDRPQQRPFALQNARAEDVAPQLRETLSRMPGKPEVIVDVNRNRVLVKGNRDALEAAADLIETLDVSDERPQETAPKPIARGYKVDPSTLDATLKSLRELYKAQPGVSINADKRTSKIVVLGPPEIQDEVATAIEAARAAQPQADEPSTAAPRTMAISDAPRRQLERPSQQRMEAIHRFRNLSWEEFEDALRRIWGPSVEVTPDEDREGAEVRLVTRFGETHFIRIDRRRNQIEAMPAEPVAKWKQIARVLDGLETKEGEEAQIMTVAHTKPVQIKKVVEALKSNERDAKKPLAIGALRRDAKTARWGGDLVSRVFEQEPGAAAPPKEAGAEQQPPATEQEPTSEDFSGISPDVRIEYIEGLDIIVIYGPPKDVERVKKLIEKLDTVPKDDLDVQIVPLTNTHNEVLAPLLTQINDQVLVNRQGRVTIIPLGKPNSILLIGQKESVRVLSSYIEKLDVEVEPTSQYRVFRLKFIPAADAETAIRNFFTNNPTSGTQQNQGGGGANAQDQNRRPGLGTRIRIISELRSNSLIVHGGPGDIRDVEALLKEIDVEDTPSVAEVRVFPLKTSLATDLAPLLQAAITGLSTQGGGNQNNQGNQGNQGGGAATTNPRSSSLQYLQTNKDGTKTIDSGIPTNVVIEAEPASNSLVVRGPSRTMDLIAHLIEKLDGVAKVGASIKVFKMEHADAQQVLTNLQTLFGVSNQAAGAQQQGAALTSPTSEGESPLVRLRFAVDRRSNSLIVAGNQGDLNIIEALLNNIDLKDAKNRKLYVYRLVNNDAQFVATAVQTLITNQQTQIRQQAQTNFLRAGQELLDLEVFIQPELVTNSVIISATPMKLAEVVRVIQHLDLRQPMVMVQMLIAEVSLENINELGAEIGLQDSILFDRGLNGLGVPPVPGFPFNNLPLGNTAAGANNAVDRQIIAPQSLTNFGLGRTSASRGYGGLVLSASSESVSVLIRALQERNRLQILSRPEVMTVDRIPAQVLVGQNVPLVGATNVTVNTTTSNIDRTNVGISLLVTPQVNADGQIMIEVDATRSALGPQQEWIPIPNGNSTILQPTINVTQAVSTLSCRSGQTVVMAGLITKNDQKSARGIPGLMEIPIVGRLFQFNAESSKRTELLMIMTPHIIWDGEDLNWLKQTETERMSWCLADVVEMNGDHGFSPGYGKWGSMNMNRIFPHTQPRGVEQCVGPPGPAPYFEKCPPEKYLPSADQFGHGPPSEIENRSNWGPMQSPLTLLKHPDEGSSDAEELTPPQPAPQPELEGPAAPPATPLDPRLPTKLQSPNQREGEQEVSTKANSVSQRAAIRSRNASTRRNATQPPPKESVAPTTGQSASRRPAPTLSRPAAKENVPARYQSRGNEYDDQQVEPAGYSEQGAARGASLPSGDRRRD